MVISILTLFPQIFKTYISTSIIGRAQKKNLVNIQLINIRDFAYDSHKSVDDRPYGGGVGMILRVDILEQAISRTRLRQQNGYPKVKEKVILLDPRGKIFQQSIARKYTKIDHLILICGHYEGIDARLENFTDETISIGKYVLTGGELPALVIADSVTRLIPGVLSKKEATTLESFSSSKSLEPSQYTRPRVYKGFKVPEVLLSGNHKEINDWHKCSSLTKDKNG